MLVFWITYNINTVTETNEYGWLFIGYKSPQVELQVVRVDLDLLQPVSTKRSQSNTLEERLQTDECSA